MHGAQGAPGPPARASVDGRLAAWGTRHAAVVMLVTRPEAPHHSRPASPTFIAGSLPSGLISRNEGERCSPLPMATRTSSKGRPEHLQQAASGGGERRWRRELEAGLRDGFAAPMRLSLTSRTPSRCAKADSCGLRKFSQGHRSTGSPSRRRFAVEARGTRGDVVGKFVPREGRPLLSAARPTLTVRRRRLSLAVLPNLCSLASPGQLSLLDHPYKVPQRERSPAGTC